MTAIDDLLGPESAAGASLGAVHAVSITWLSKVFRMDKTTVKTRLAECAPWSRVGNYPVYDIAQAAAYLIPPSVDITERIMALDPADLPPHLASEFWGAKLKRQKWEREAGDLWRHADVIEVFGEVFNRIDDSMRSWVQGLESADALTDGQRTALTGMAEGILDDLRGRLLEAPAARQERNQSAVPETTEADVQADG